MQPLKGVQAMKISKLEKILLGCTAAFLLLAAGYYLGVRDSAVPYRVDTETRKEPPAPEEETSVPEESPTAPIKINLNTATAAELETLPDIGEKRAQDIVADREANGPFRIVEDVTRVSGIGEGTLAKIIDYITVT